jgi:hypothetical protein
VIARSLVTSFMQDLRARLANKVQLTTDGHKAYRTAVSEIDFDADYAMPATAQACDWNICSRESNS